MNRRDFLKQSTISAGTLALASAGSPSLLAADEPAAGAPFKLKYAPHFNMFKQSAGESLEAQLQFMHDQGFRALEDNRMLSRPMEEQDLIARTMERLGMEMGVFVATGSFQEPTFASGKKEFREVYLQDIKASVELAKRVNAKWVTVVPGIFDHKLPLDYQTANVIEGLKYCAELCEPSGLIMVLEPLNHFANHPELFLHKIPQAYLICKAVGSPSCKILFDLYHQQITEGNLIPNIDHAWSEIAYFQTGDNPGRKEPGTGEINYRNIFRHLHAKGYEGIIGMEHGNSRKGVEGEQAVIAAYRDADNF
ncbi:MAG: TIM barrel protein [Planctomycetaceae bacterium]|nr:TIM barrel protein [Planctomycetaceae bacterium]